MQAIKDLQGPPSLPLFGNLFDLKLDALHIVLRDWSRQYGDLYRFRLGPRNCVATADKTEIQTILRERPNTFRRVGTVEPALKELGLHGLFSAEGEVWRKQRRLVVQALNSAHLRQFYPNLRATTDRLQKRWSRAAESQKSVDLIRDLMLYTVDVTTQLAFGKDFNTLETDGPVIQQRLERVFPMVNYRTNAPFPYWRYLRLPRDRALDRALASVRIEVQEMIEQCRQRVAADPTIFDNPSNFLEAIIAAQQSEKLELSDEEIYGNVMTLLLAGEDTTAHSLGWACKLFMEYPEHFRQVRSEVDRVFKGKSAEQRLDEGLTLLNQLPFTDAFIQESMRVQPVAPLHIYEPIEDAIVADCEIPAGTPIFLLMQESAVSDPSYEDPQAFLPDRWLSDEKSADGAFFPFGGGPRFCPGRNLAMLEIKSVIAMLCENFEIELANPETPVDETFAFTLMPTNLDVRFRARKPSTTTH